MTDVSNFPPPLGRHRIRAIAFAFSSPTGKIADILDIFDRRRCQARIAFERGYAVAWDFEVSRDCEDAAAAEAAILRAHHEIAENEAFARDECKRPALLRAAVCSLLEPFNERWGFDAYIPLTAQVAPGPKIRAKLPDARLQHIALVCGSQDESAKRVPLDRRKEFESHLEFHRQALEEMLADACRFYKSSDGTPGGIPPEALAVASRDWQRRMRLFDLRCQFELELLRIDFDESKAKEQARKRAEECEAEEQRARDVEFGFG